MTYQAARGMRDILPEDIPGWELVERTARRIARLYGYREIRPPLLEETELFVRSVGEVTDIVEKEMFTFQKGDTSLSLRPEGTAGIVRAYLQAGYAKSAPVQKLFTIGPMFRYERPQKGRERQFTQFDMEAIGSLDPRLDAELVDAAASFFETIGITGLEVRLNSLGDGEDRDRYREAVREFVRPHLEERCELCRARFERNVLRVLDCKNPTCQGLNQGAPSILDHLSPENRAHFDQVLAHLRLLGRASDVDPGIVRGLDYYTRTIFEIHAPRLAARSALCGGGRYDHLVRDLGGPDMGAVGFAIGFTGTLLALEALEEELGEEPEARKRSREQRADVYAVAAGAECAAEVLVLATELRKAGISCVFDHEGRTVKAQMRAAGSGGHAAAVIVGSEELQRRTVQVKDLAKADQVEVPRGALAAHLRRLLGGQREADPRSGSGILDASGNPQLAPLRLGILGGSFDPVHAGHLHVARAARSAFELDRVVFVPAARPPHKPDRVLADAGDRLAMVELAIAGEPRFFATDLELLREGPSYTIDTVRALPSHLGLAAGAELYLILGSDNLPDLADWREADLLVRLAQPIIIYRGGDPSELLAEAANRLSADLRPRLERGFLPLSPVEISSSDVRDRLARGEDPGENLPRPVMEYIRRRGIYGFAAGR